MTDTSRFRVFISYSHDDEKDLFELKKHLKLLESQHVLLVWHDHCIGVGEEFDTVIAHELEAADIILLLVSANFFDSDYCYEIELKRAMERHDAGNARVIPVIVRSYDNWQSASFGRLKAAPDGGKPIEDFPSRDKGFVSVARFIRFAAAQLRAKREAELKPSVNAPPRGLASGWYVPHDRNINFTGRNELLERLHQELSSGEPAALVQALSGLGGIGKSQTAIEYAYRHRKAYQLVWWLRAEEPTMLAADYVSMAPSLGLETSDDQNQIIAAVRSRLEEENSWLLIFDNAGEVNDLRPYLPSQRRGRIIITSRNPSWGSIAKPVQVDVMGEEEAVTLLLKNRPANEADAARFLAKDLGYLPLALAQANAYCENAGRTLASYRNLLSQRDVDLLAKSQTAEGYNRPVAAAWDLAFETIKPIRGAADLLNLLSYLAPDPFPKTLLTEHADELKGDLASIARDPIELDQTAILPLRRASLIDTTNDTLSAHRLVQAITRSRCRAASIEHSVVDAAVRLVSAALPSGASDVRTWSVYTPLLSHATTVASHAERLAVAPEYTGRILNQIALHLKSRASYGEALPLYERAIKIGEDNLGPKHPNIAKWLNNLANLYQAQGLFDKALPLYERDIRITEKHYGYNHPDLATSLNNLAKLYQRKGQYDKAFALFQRAVEISKGTLDPNHSDLAISLANFAEIHGLLGRYGEALSLFQDALIIGQQSLGADHPERAKWLNSLATLYSDQSHYEEALPLYQRAVEIVEAKLPPTHPHVTLFRRNYEICLREAGRPGGS